MVEKMFDYLKQYIFDDPEDDVVWENKHAFLVLMKVR